MLQNHDNWWKYIPDGALNQIYIATAVRSFSVALLGLFVPIYLYNEIGFSLQQVLGYYIFFSIILAVSSPIAMKFASRHGLKHTILFSVQLYLIFIMLLYLLQWFPIPLVLISFFLGLSIAFYWMGLHLVFHKASDKKHRGEEVGKREGYSILVTILSPIIGGLLIKFAGFTILFLLSGFLLLFSAFILFKSKEDYIRYKFSFRSILNKNNWKYSLYFVSRGTWIAASGVIWPLFIFSILNSYISLGLIGSILSGFMAVLVSLTGKFSDKFGKRKIIRSVVWFESTFWFLKAFVTTVTQVFSVTILGAISFGIMEAPLCALEYDQAKNQAASFFVMREIFLCLGRVLLFSFVFLTDSLFGGLILQGFANLAFLLI
ncbi:MAG: MFS transporter [archaeon]|nr:MFS transporter [archaeon]